MAAPACCTIPPSQSDYKAQGSEFKIGDLKVYETKDKSPKLVLICIYDIFGFHPNTMQFADKINSCGVFRVAMPDIFRGKPFPLKGFPPKDTTELMKFINVNGSWDNVVKKDLTAIINYYKQQGATTFGVYGFCWGGRMCLKAAAELSDIKAAALLHPFLLETADANPVKVPVIFLPSKDEPDLIPMVNIVKKNVGADKVAHQRFDDMTHGFAAARGNWKNDKERKRAEEALTLVHNFMKKYVAGK